MKRNKTILVIALCITISTCVYAGLDTGISDDGLGHLQTNSLFDPTTGEFGTDDAKGLYYPEGIALDSSGHRLFVCDTFHNRILVFNLNEDNNLEDREADFVLGQENFYGIHSNRVQQYPSDNTLSYPSGIAYSSTDNLLYVADTNNNRVLIFDVEEITNGESSIGILGQPNYYQNTSNRGQTTVDEKCLNGPTYILLDETRNRIWVADTGNHRLLLYTLPIVNQGQAANNVLGQANFATVTRNRGAASPTAKSLHSPRGMIFYENADDNTVHLWVADTGNSRIVHYDVTEGTLADGADALDVIGQEDFTGQSMNRGLSAPESNTLSLPYSLSLDSTKNYLYAADTGNNRIMIFDIADATLPAVGQIGQNNYIEGNANRGEDIPSASTLNYPNTIIFAGETLAVSDSHNNRILLFYPSTFEPLGATSTSSTTAASTATASSDSGGGGCFIATSCFSLNKYGRKTLPPESLQKLNSLRKYRDTKLAVKNSGRCFIKFYYTFGPSAARFIDDNSPLKRIVREILVEPCARFLK